MILRCTSLGRLFPPEKPTRRKQDNPETAGQHAVLGANTHQACLMSGKKCRQRVRRHKEIHRGNDQKNDAENLHPWLAAKVVKQALLDSADFYATHRADLQNNELRLRNGGSLGRNPGVNIALFVNVAGPSQERPKVTMRFHVLLPSADGPAAIPCGTPSATERGWHTPSPTPVRAHI